MDNDKGKQTSLKWYQINGPEGDVVISARVRLARNYSDTPFPEHLDENGKKKVIQRTLNGFDILGLKNQFDYINMENIQTRDAMSMVERHLISPEFAFKREGSGLLINNDESVSVMLNEEDHVRIQIMSSGYNLDEIYRKADELERNLDTVSDFAFDDRLGYLTQCPTNLGTGMRASLMLHLPALQEHGAIRQLANTVSKLGLTIRGMYGEGSKSEGAIYQLSNQVTLGISEKAAIENLKGIATQIIKQERMTREKLSESIKVQDLVWRSLGVLKTARILTQEEFMALISNIRIGIALGIVKDISLDTVNALLCDAQPSSIMSVNKEDMDKEKQDVLRADMVRNVLKE